MEEEELTAQEHELVDHASAVLADAAVWETPSSSLADSIVASIRADTAAAGPPRRSRWLGLAGAAAAGAIAAGVITAVAVRDDSPPSTASAKADLTAGVAGTDLAPNVAGTAAFTSLSSGVRIVLAVPGLPRLEGDDYYEVWLRNCDGTKSAPAGTFHDLTAATAWAGVSLDEYPELTVTKEVAAAPDSPDQASSGQIVAVGHAC